MNEILLVNPRKRRKGRKAKSRRRGRVRLKRTASRRRRVHRVRARRYKRNPSGGGFSLRSVGSQVVPILKASGLGAVGALANDALVGQVRKLTFLPDALRSGYGAHALKIATAFGVGVAANFVAKGKARDLAVGAGTVAVHGLIRDVIAQQLPTVAPYLGDVDGYNPGQLVDESGMGAYVPGIVGDYEDDNGVGAYVPGMVAGDDDM